MEELILRAMSANDFQIYHEHSVIQYAQEKMKGEFLNWEDAKKNSVDTFARLLPERENTPNHYLYNVFFASTNSVGEALEKVGHFWFHILEKGGQKVAFLYDIEITSKYQGQGFGKKVMLAYEQKAKELGASKSSLHVFGHNNRAQELYTKLNYIITNINMSKIL